MHMSQKDIISVLKLQISKVSASCSVWKLLDLSYLCWIFILPI